MEIHVIMIQLLINVLKDHVKMLLLLLLTPLLVILIYQIAQSTLLNAKLKFVKISLSLLILCVQQHYQIQLVQAMELTALQGEHVLKPLHQLHAQQVPIQRNVSGLKLPQLLLLIAH